MRAPELNSRNPELHTNKITMTEHAYIRASERLGLHDRQIALTRIRSMLRQAECIGTIFAEDGNESVWYVHNKVIIVLNPELDRVLTIKKEQYISHPKFRIEALNWHRKEIRKLTRLERSRVRKLHIEGLRTKAEIANLDYRKVKTRSENVRKYCDEQKKTLKEQIYQIEKELLDIRTEKRRVANSLSAII